MRWGVPDWRDESAYPDPETPMHEWKWQFLRRRPDYREFWASRIDGDFEESCQYAEWARKDDPNYPMPQAKFGWSVSGSIFSDAGATQTLDPSWPHYRPASSVFGTRGRVTNRWRREYNEHAAAFDDGLFSIEFDLDQSLPDQIRRAEKILRIEQTARRGQLVTSPRHHISKWATYLRVIDARDDGQSWASIATVLVYTRGSPQAAQQTWEQAQDLMFKIGR